MRTVAGGMRLGDVVGEESSSRQRLSDPARPRPACLLVAKTPAEEAGEWRRPGWTASAEDAVPNSEQATPSVQREVDGASWSRRVAAPRKP